MNDQIEQIRRAHENARPKPSNPAWCNTHRDLGVTLAALGLDKYVIQQYQLQVEQLKAELKADWDAYTISKDNTNERIEQLEAVRDMAEIAYSELAFAVHDLAGRRLYNDSDIDRRAEKLAKCADELRRALDNSRKVAHSET